MARLLILAAACALAAVPPLPARGGADAGGELSARALAALERAGTYYRTRVATHGGYVYYYSLDLAQRWGEGTATRDQVWVQPPGTPTVGLAFLRAHAATGTAAYLDAARAAAEALVHGQLESGGWTNCIDFDPRGARVARYRGGAGRGANNSTLDDGISQAAIRFLVRADRALAFKHARVHRAASDALDALLRAQFPNGAFPQVWTGPVAAQPVLPASFPSHDWRTEGKIKNYWDMYTLNDNVAGSVTEALAEAAAVYGGDRWMAALRRLGDFLILAQMPEPQPAWAQQYSYRMHPIWARRFEPPAISGSESQDAIGALLEIHRLTGDAKYLRPVPAALAYLKRSRLPDGRMARYYELKSNRPLYMTRAGRDYSLTYDDSNLPGHYGWKVASRLEELEEAYRARLAGRPSKAAPSAAELEPQVRRIVEELDAEGRWVSTYAGEPLVGQPPFRAGSRYIASEVFSRRVGILCDYLDLTLPARK